MFGQPQPTTANNGFFGNPSTTSTAPGGGGGGLQRQTSFGLGGAPAAPSSNGTGPIPTKSPSPPGDGGSDGVTQSITSLPGTQHHTTFAQHPVGGGSFASNASAPSTASGQQNAMYPQPQTMGQDATQQQQQQIMGNNVGTMQPHDNCCCDPTTKWCDCLNNDVPGQQTMPPSTCDNSTCAIMVMFFLTFLGFIIIAATGKDLVGAIGASEDGGDAVYDSICSMTKDLKLSTCGNWGSGGETNGSSDAASTNSTSNTTNTGSSNSNATSSSNNKCTVVSNVGYFIKTPPKVCAEDFFSPAFIQTHTSILQNYLVTFYLVSAIFLLYTIVIAVRHNDNREESKMLNTINGGMGMTSQCCSNGQQPPDPNAPQTMPILFHNTPQYHSFMQIWFLGGCVAFLWGLSTWYPLLEVFPVWKKHADGQLADFFAANELKFMAGTFALIPIVCFPFIMEIAVKPFTWCVCILPWCVYRSVGDTRVQSRPPGVPSPITHVEDAVVPFGTKEPEDVPCCIELDNFFLNNSCCRKALASVQESVAQQAAQMQQQQQMDHMQQQQQAQGAAMDTNMQGMSQQQQQQQQAAGGGGPAGMQYTPSKVDPNGSGSDHMPPQYPRSAFAAADGNVKRSLVLSDDGGLLSADGGLMSDDEERKRRKKEKKREKKEKKAEKEALRASKSSPLIRASSGLQASTSTGFAGTTTLAASSTTAGSPLGATSAGVRSSAAFSEFDDDDMVRTGVNAGSVDMNDENGGKREKKSKKDKKDKKEKREKKEKKRSKSPE